jgi:hypothetical protein
VINKGDPALEEDHGDKSVHYLMAFQASSERFASLAEAVYMGLIMYGNLGYRTKMRVS